MTRMFPSPSLHSAVVAIVPDAGLIKLFLVLGELQLRARTVLNVNRKHLKYKQLECIALACFSGELVTNVLLHGRRNEKNL